MTGKTHAAVGLFVGVALARSLGVTDEQAALTVALAVIGSLAPDLDTPQSYISRLLILNPVHLFVRHRGVLHSGLVAGLLMVAGLVHPLALPFAMGYASHILIDALTVSGVPVLWPRRESLRGPFRTGGLMDHLLWLAAIAGAGLQISQTLKIG